MVTRNLHIGILGAELTLGSPLTDNAILRANGTRGVQNSLDIIDDNGNIIMPDGASLATGEVRARDGGGLKLYDDGGNGIFVKDGGNVGIGTTTPSYKLEVKNSSGTPIAAINTQSSGGNAVALYGTAATANDDNNTAIYAYAANSGAGDAYSFYGVGGTFYNTGNAQVTGSAAIGNDASIGTGTFWEGEYTLNPILNSVSDVSNTDQGTVGLWSQLFLSNTAINMACKYGIIGNVETKADNAQDSMNIRGIQGAVDHVGTGTLSEAVAGYFFTEIKKTGDITNAYGVRSRIATLNVGGAITNAYGLTCEGVGMGTISNYYGLYLPDAPGTTNYGVYQGNNTAINYFNGVLGIGVVPTTAKLEVTHDNSDVLQLTSTDPGGAGARITTRHFSASPADGDDVMILLMKGYNDAGTPEEIDYARIRGIAADVSDGSEDGTIDFYTMINGSLTRVMAMINGNVGIRTATFGTNAVGSLAIATTTVPTSSIANQIEIFSTDISGDDATLGLRTEAAVAVEVDETKFSHKLPIKINGATYYMMLCDS